MFTEGDDNWFGNVLTPSVDVTETDDQVDVKMDLPGMKAEEIDIQVRNNILTIKGYREEEKEEKQTTFHRIERRTGSFSRTLPLPSFVDENKVDAQYKDGVLKISMPKTKEAKAKKIAVKA
jgi:HSP20 family protein